MGKAIIFASDNHATNNQKNEHMKMKDLLLVTIATLGLTASTMAQNLPNYVPANGLVGWWPFTGNANDESGNGHNGTANGAALTSDRFGNAEKAYGFDGLNDNIIIPHNENLNSYPLTINIWLRSNGDIDGGILITKYCCSNWQGWDIQVSQAYEDTAVFTREYLRGGCLGLFQWYCGEQQQQKHTAFDDVWHMYTFRIDSFGASIFWDGIQVGSQEWIGQPGPINNILDLCIGSYYNEGGFYTGLLDDIGIWNRPLNQQEITDLYNSNMGITGFNPATYNNTIKIYPNPANNHITIDYGNFATMNGYQLKIENSLGQQLFQTNITQQTDYLSLNNWGGNGLYFVHIIDALGNTIDIRKIVLQ
jgi:hypothetical protein